MYAHGFDNRGEIDYTRLGQDLSSWGFVVAFPKSCHLGCKADCRTLPFDPPCFADYYKQQLRVIEWSRFPEIRAVLPVDERLPVGVAGHSMGGQVRAGRTDAPKVTSGAVATDEALDAPKVFLPVPCTRKRPRAAGGMHPPPPSAHAGEGRSPGQQLRRFLRQWMGTRRSRLGTSRAAAAAGTANPHVLAPLFPPPAVHRSAPLRPTAPAAAVTRSSELRTTRAPQATAFSAAFNASSHQIGAAVMHHPFTHQYPPIGVRFLRSAADRVRRALASRAHQHPERIGAGLAQVTEPDLPK